jgi:membrane-bound lytic murein transglycosylase D
VKYRPSPLETWTRPALGLALAGLFAFAAAGGVTRARSLGGVAPSAAENHSAPVDVVEAKEVIPLRPVPITPLAAAGAAGEADEAGEAAVPAWDLPNLDHERVDYFVSLFTGRKRDEFAGFLTRMGHYQPIISRKLAERGMPQDLIYLAMIESGFRPKAYSHAHASGLWQFISGTARRYGLDINRAVDERNDPEKATDAALDYLEDLHDQFGSWYLAAAAYHSGEGRVARIMRSVTGSVRGNEYSYYRIRSRLPRETRDYVPLMVAAARIAKQPHRYGFAEVARGSALAFETVEVPPATPLANIARASGTTVAELRRLNPQLKLSRTRNDQKDVIRIPAGSGDRFASSWIQVRRQTLASAETPSVRRYRVRRGDNLTVIARRHGTTVAALKQVNGLRSDRIRAGATLRIPA